MICTNKDLKEAYRMMKYLPHLSDVYKRDIRAYNNREPQERYIVKDNGIDGIIVRYPLPERIKDMETAVSYFEEQEFIDRPDSPYDCTGKIFTSWYKIVNKRGRFWAYHSIGMDV